MSRAVTTVGILNVMLGRTLIVLAGMAAFEVVKEGFADLVAIVLPILLTPSILTALSGWGVWDRRKWGRILMIVVGTGWSVGLGALSYSCAVDDHSPLTAMGAFLGAIYAVICVLMMFNRANRAEFA